MEDLSLVFAVGLAVAVAVVLGTSRVDPLLKRVLIGGAVLRVVGALAYYGVAEHYYGRGDYQMYHAGALEYAERLWQGDFTMFVTPSEWRSERWWGTQFVLFPAAIVVACVGTHIVSTFIVFSLLAFAGLAALARAFARSFPNVSPERYAVWIFLFPSLWFWSAALGKDALLLCGVGLAVYGFVGDRGRLGWVPLILGVGLVFGIRPQVAAVVVLAMVLAQWGASVKSWSWAKALQAVVFSVAGIASIHVALGTAGAGGADLEGVQEYVEAKSASAAQGRTSVEAVAPGWQSAPLALVNILFRPFPWEARSVTTLLASGEIWTLWTIAYTRRRNIAAALLDWRSSRLIAFALIFTLGYAVSLGLVVVNMGIIARQRIVLFPFLFLLMEARPATLAIAGRGFAHARRSPFVPKPRPRRFRTPSANEFMSGTGVDHDR